MLTAVIAIIDIVTPLSSVHPAQQPDQRVAVAALSALQRGPSVASLLTAHYRGHRVDDGGCHGILGVSNQQV
jgi:hypothetical protein